MSQEAKPTAVAGAAPDPDPADRGFDDFEELPPRVRRRLATPANLGLLAVLIVALGFIGGVLVEKGQTSGTGAGTGAGAGAGAGRRAALAGGAGGGTRTGGVPAGATVGTVATVDGRTLYVTDLQGTTIKVAPASSATVIRTAATAVSAIHPGDTIVVQGTKAPDGSETASSIRATAPGAAGGGFGGGLGGGAAVGGSARGTGAGASPATGGAAGPATQLFGG